jgi:hypothetical protein
VRLRLSASISFVDLLIRFMPVFNLVLAVRTNTVNYRT